MNYHTLMAVLVKLGVIERDRAEALADKLVRSVQPARFKDAEKVVEDVFKSVDSNK